MPKTILLAFDEDALGMAIVLIGYSLMTWLLARLLLSAEAREHASPLRLLLGLGITLLPLGLIIAVGFGYYYTALKLTDRLIDTLPAAALGRGGSQFRPWTVGSRPSPGLSARTEQAAEYRQGQ